MSYPKCMLLVAIGWTIMEVQPLHFVEISWKSSFESIFNWWAFLLTVLFFHWWMNRPLTSAYQDNEHG